MQLKAGYLKGLCQARPKWVNKNNQRRCSDNPAVQAEEFERIGEKAEKKLLTLSPSLGKKGNRDYSVNTVIPFNCNRRQSPPPSISFNLPQMKNIVDEIISTIGIAVPTNVCMTTTISVF